MSFDASLSRLSFSCCELIFCLSLTYRPGSTLPYSYQEKADLRLCLKESSSASEAGRKFHALVSSSPSSASTLSEQKVLN